MTPPSTTNRENKELHRDLPKQDVTGCEPTRSLAVKAFSINLNIDHPADFTDDAQAAMVAASAGAPAKLSRMMGAGSGREGARTPTTAADFTISDFEFKNDFQNADPWEVSLSEFITEDFACDSQWGFFCVDSVVEATLVGNRYVPGVLRRVPLRPSLRSSFHPEIFLSVVKLPTRHSTYRFTLLGENRQPVTVKSGRILFTLHFRRTQVRRSASAYERVQDIADDEDY